MALESLFDRALNAASTVASTPIAERYIYGKSAAADLAIARATGGSVPGSAVPSPTQTQSNTVEETEKPNAILDILKMPIVWVGLAVVGIVLFMQFKK